MSAHRPYSEYVEFSAAEMLARSQSFQQSMTRRRSVREFSPRDVPQQVIERCIAAAGTAPSGANQQPWHFACVSDANLKATIREAAEKEEREFYERRASEEWLTALKPFGTNAEKPFLERAPWLVAIFAESYGMDEEGDRHKNYYVQESVGIATGLLIAALTNAGLATLTHTPSPMEFLGRILGRPTNERPFLLLVVGYPAEGVSVPDISRKPLDQIASWQ